MKNGNMSHLTSGYLDENTEHYSFGTCVLEDDTLTNFYTSFIDATTVTYVSNGIS
jgi:hypothetical protein